MLVALAGFFDHVVTWYTALFHSGAYAVQLAKIIGIDLVLAGDNAVVIALACRLLPPKQRMTGIILGAAAAVVLRILFTLTVQQLLGIELLKLLGGLLLLWIGVKLLLAEEASEESVRSGSNLWEAVRIVALADMIMSLDNVLAIAAAAHGDASLIVLGLLISIPLVVGGATLITSLLTRFPIFVWAGAGLLGWVAGELIATEPVLQTSILNLAANLGTSVPAIVHLFQIGGAGLVCCVAYVLRRSAEASSET